LSRLGLPFTVAIPAVAETVEVGERPDQLVERLSRAKAQAVAPQHPHAVIIASDQVAALEGEILRKPGTQDKAKRQLQRCSGRAVVFYTGLCVQRSDEERVQTAVEPFTVVFRPLREPLIDSYLRREQPYDCAGSFKSEGLGIALLERMIGADPTALVGLPLIRLVRMLEGAGVAVE
jgi:septum formation protein